MNLWNNDKFTPMLLQEINKPFNNKDYLYEIKYDGIRACIIVSKDIFKIINRHHEDITYIYPELKNIQKDIKSKTILDGEIVVMDSGFPSFSLLQKRCHLRDKNKIKKHMQENPVIFITFDILFANQDLTNIPLIQRKEYLNKIKDSNYLIKSKVFSNGLKLFNEVKKLNLEGIVAKEKHSYYIVNSRSDSWLKIKNNKAEIFLVGGYILNKNNTISLLLGEYNNKDLYYVGKVKISKKQAIYDKIINAKKIKRSPFINYNSNFLYLKPIISVNIHYLERTKNNHLRHALFKGLVID